MKRGGADSFPGHSWDLSPDAERFLVIEGTEQDLALAELQVLTFFLDRLRQALLQK